MRGAGWLALGVCLAGCAGPVVSPFPRVGPLDDAATVAVLRSRTAAIRSAYGVVTMEFERPERSGTVDAVVQWQRPDLLRVTAFKDLVITARDVFDLLLGAEQFAVELPEEEDGEAGEAGPRAEFPRAYPDFAGFYWAGEAIFLGGAVHAQGRVTSRSDARVEVEADLISGARARWLLDAERLTPLEGEVEAPDGRRITLRYHAWTAVGEAFLPARVEFLDEAAGLRVEMEAQELELNVELDPAVFDPLTVGAGAG